MVDSWLWLRPPEPSPLRHNALVHTRVSKAAMSLLHAQNGHFGSSLTIWGQHRVAKATRQVACLAASGSLFSWPWKKTEEGITSVILQSKLEQHAQEDILLAMRAAKHLSD